MLEAVAALSTIKSIATGMKSLNMDGFIRSCFTFLLFIGLSPIGRNRSLPNDLGPGRIAGARKSEALP